MKERPILFNGEMVRAILDSRKTQTRRVIKPMPFDDEQVGFSFFSGTEMIELRSIAGSRFIKNPYGAGGDQLWVKENWTASPSCINLRYCPDVLYKADNWPAVPHKWKSSRFMPRWASRIQLEIVRMRVERVQDITKEDAIAEGMTCDLPFCDQRNEYEDVWNKINSKRGFGWDMNPWVWVIEFKRVEDQ